MDRLKYRDSETSISWDRCIERQEKKRQRRRKTEGHIYGETGVWKGRKGDQDKYMEWLV